MELLPPTNNAMTITPITMMDALPLVTAKMVGLAVVSLVSVFPFAETEFVLDPKLAMMETPSLAMVALPLVP